MEVKNFDYMLEIDILRNSSPKILGVLRGAFQGFGCPKRHPDALLAKTMTDAHSRVHCFVKSDEKKILMLYTAILTFDR